MSESILSACRQQYPLPPDIRYVLDGMLEDQLLDQGSYIALNLFVPRTPILAVIDAEEPSDELPMRTYKARQLKQGLILDLVDQHLRELPQIICDGLAHCSLDWLRRDFYSLAEVYAMWVHEDETTGGALKDFRQQVRVRRNGEVFPRTARRIRSPSYIARYVKQREESFQRREMATRLLDRVERAQPENGRGFLHEVEAELAAQREAARTSAIRQLCLEQANVGHLPEVAAMLKRVLSPAKKRQRQRRAVIRRALNVAAAVLPDQDVRAFVHGQGVRLPGQTMDLVVRPRGSVAERGHGAIDVQVTAPASSEVLASLCTYIERTPALDQLVGFALAMQAGEEADIIAKANITNLLPAGRDHPLLAAREKQHVVDRAAPRLMPNRRGVWSLADVREYANAYWDETKHMWVERLSVFACGRRVKMLTADGA